MTITQNRILRSNSILLGTGAFLFALVLVVVPGLAKADTLTRQLDIGMSGSDVSALQTYLTQDATLYPSGLVTGYFGALTSAGVSRFQTANGIASVGRVGPVTLTALNAKMNGSNVTGFDRAAPSIYAIQTSVSGSEATISWNTSENAAAVVYYANAPLVQSEAGPNSGVTIGGSSALVHSDLRSSHSTTLTGLSGNTNYYYVLYVRDGSGNETVSTQLTFHTN